MGLNKSKNEFLIPLRVSSPIRPEATTHEAWQPATHGRLKGWLGLGLAAWSSGETARDAVTACDGAVVCSPAARWWLAGGKVLPVSLRGPQGGRRARRSGVELTRAAARQLQ
jgi:hypothetical protein